MEIIGDTNATLKDLTRIVEAEIMEADDPLYPKICSEVKSADEAYIKLPIQDKVAFPVAFDGEREAVSTEVAVVQTYSKNTYALTLDYNSDLMRESKAYTFEEKTQEGASSAKIFPSYNLSVNIVEAGTTNLLSTGVAGVSVATFAAYAGAGLTLKAYNGLWQVMSSVGITFT